MDRRELETAASKMINLRGLLAVPAGLLFIATGLANLGSGLPGDPFSMVMIIAAFGVSTLAINRYYNQHFGRVRLTREQQVRFGVAGLLLFGGPMIGGTLLDFNTDLPVSLFCVLFGLGMLAWFAYCVGLQRHHVLIWGALVVVGLIPMWGGLDDRASVAWIPIGVATALAGVFDHLALARTYGPTADAHAEA